MKLQKIVGAAILVWAALSLYHIHTLSGEEYIGDFIGDFIGALAAVWAGSSLLLYGKGNQ